MSIAIITGASSGLGVEFVKKISVYYPEIKEYWVVARRMNRLEKLSEFVKGITITPIKLDLTDEVSFDKFEGLLKEKNPDVKLLINNAGMGNYGPFTELERDKHVMQCDLNVTAVTEVASVVLPYMSAGSTMINTCSIAAFVPNANLTVYSSTKAYVYSLSKGLRYELKERKINVLAVCSGPMETEFLTVAKIKGNSKTFDTLPYCKPEKVAAGALKAAKKGRGVYTPRFIYKFYRVLSKIVPDAIMMHFAKA